MKKRIFELNILEIVIFLIIGIFFENFFEISQVNGISMEPTLQDGDYIITLHGLFPTDGDIIIVNTENNKYYDCNRIVKRYIAEKSDENNIWVEGDNVDVSLDSRITGTLERKDIIGVVILDINKIFR